MAGLLGVAREWLSKIENGKTPVSADVFLAFEKLLREHKHTSQGMVHEAKAGSGPVDMFGDLRVVDATFDGTSLRDEVRRIFEESLAAAEADPGRLGWLREQLLKHLAVPDHWRKRERLPGLTAAHEKAIRKNLRDEAKKKPDTHLSEKPHGIAGSSGP
eukprot:TRINITY_DN96662_c0_g1_i1.p1 TRINITY_DN96662_c0_g1~~TRINITY_DN96662_c0_g1_i1.p1  ORF type:complete len:159 (-),score=18.92 TRINITY_DN96662_c0_g1_i1:209-685(-)